MFGSLDPAKLLVILVIALVVIGPERLPKAARQLGSAWRELTRIRERVTDEVKAALPDLGLDDLDLPHLPRNPSAAVSSFVRDLTSGMTAGTAGGLAADGAADAGAEDAVEVMSTAEWSAGVPAGGRMSGLRGSGRAPERLRPGGQIPEHAVVVALAPESGELAVCYDDPAMN